MPLSRLDLPRIVEAVQELHRIIADPPAENWRAPAWLIEQYKQTTLGEAGVPGRPSHAWLIDAAATEVLNRLMPPWHHTKAACPEITDSLLDMRHKVKLIELRGLLSSFALGQRLVDNRGEALRVLAFLESVQEQLSADPIQLLKERAAQEGRREAVERQQLELLRRVEAERDNVRHYGERAGPAGSTRGLAEQIARFLAAVRAVGWGERVEALQPGDN